MILLPNPKKVQWFNNKLPKTNNFQIIGENETTKKGVLKLEKLLKAEGYFLSSSHSTPVTFIKKPSLVKEQYEIMIDEGGISFIYGTENGAFYAVVTFKQILLQSPDGIPYVQIFDEPDLENRGLMIDISRNRVFKAETVCGLIDKLSDLKLNQLQLYIEGQAYYYPSKDRYYSGPFDYMTKEDVRLIDDYCKMNCVRFIPNQNSFGHMSYWLSLDEYKHMAECPDGYSYKWMHNAPSSTLNPLLEESYDFVTGLYDEYLEGFSETTFNIGGDEPFELGFGASKAECEKNSKGKVYVDFILKLKKYLDAKGLRMMMWGDVIKNHPDIINLLPKDIIALEWGYDKADFTEEKCKLYKDSGFEYYVCPGTSMWNSLVGIHENMLLNIKSAARLGSLYGASGLLNTDWGDGGTWQQLSFLYFSYSVGCVYSWNSRNEQDEEILDYLDTFIYKDKNKKLARILYDCGEAYHIEKEKAANSTQLWRLLYLQQTDHIVFDFNPTDPMYIIKDKRRLSQEEYQEYAEFFSEALKRYEECDLSCENKDIVNDEILLTFKLLLVAAKLGIYVTDLYSQTKEGFILIKDLLKDSIDRYYKTWEFRNKKSDFQLSIYRLNLLYKKILTIVE